LKLIKYINKKVMKFKTYIAYRGYKAVKVWSNASGMYAQLKEFKSSAEGFTQVLQGGTVVRLSHKDVDNPLITGLNQVIIF
jgi:hypothetical protein